MPTSLYLGVLHHVDAAWLIPPLLSTGNKSIRGAALLESNDYRKLSKLSSEWASDVVVNAGIGSEPVEFVNEMFCSRIDGSSASVEIRIKNPFDSNPTQRAVIRSNFSALRYNLDGWENSGRLFAGAARLITRRVAESLPLMISLIPETSGQLSEPLYFQYGLQPRQVELHPGMRLRVHSAASQFIPPAQSALNGHVASGTECATIRARHPDRKLTFDAFLGTIGPLNIQRPNPCPIAGFMDLQSEADARRHYRLFYPETLPPPDHQNTSIAANVTLAGADLVSELDAAYPTPVDGDEVVYSVFRGRATVVPELRIYINDIPEYVPVGTTLRQIIEAETGWGPEETFLAMNRTSRAKEPTLLFWRFWGSGRHKSRTGQTSTHTHQPILVQIGAKNDAIRRLEVPLLDIPLLQGDRLELPKRAET